MSSQLSMEEKRRLRQEKIKAQSASRLAKITKDKRYMEPEPTTLSAKASMESLRSSSIESSTTGATSARLRSNLGSYNGSSDNLNNESSGTPVQQQQPIRGVQRPIGSDGISSPELESESPAGSFNISGGGNDDDPLFKLLSQLNSVTSDSSGNEEKDFNAFASQFASMMGMPAPPQNNAGGAGAPPVPPPPPVTPKSKFNDMVWTAIHFFLFTFLALFSGLTLSRATPFSDYEILSATEYDELSDTEVDPNILALRGLKNSKLFLYFCTFELILQTTRFFLEKGAPPAGSMISTVASYLPQPFSGYLYTGARYIRIVGTIFQDFCVLLFVAGISTLFY